jgi:hypothetical protein
VSSDASVSTQTTTSPSLPFQDIPKLAHSSSHLLSHNVPIVTTAWQDHVSPQLSQLSMARPAVPNITADPLAACSLPVMAGASQHPHPQCCCMHRCIIGRPHVPPPHPIPLYCDNSPAAGSRRIPAHAVSVCTVSTQSPTLSPTCLQPPHSTHCLRHASTPLTA